MIKYLHMVKPTELLTWFLLPPDVKHHNILQCRQSAAAWNVVKCVPFHLDSESIMGSLSLQPDMKDESSDLELENGFLNQLKDKYCCKMKVSSTVRKLFQCCVWGDFTNLERVELKTHMSWTVLLGWNMKLPTYFEYKM